MARGFYRGIMKFFDTLAAFSSFVGSTFAVWVLILAALSFFFPSLFTPFAGYIPILLGVVMFGMGLTLKPGDFSEVFRRPLEVLIGVIGQFVIMPVTAWILCKALSLPPEIAAGVILVGCCPGGTSSNVMSFLAKGDVPLSVTITACTTLLAPLVTPFLIYLFARSWVDVALLPMFISILEIVLLPIAGGVIISHFAGGTVEKAKSVLPLISAIAIGIIVCAVVAKSKDSILHTGALVFLVVILHNCLGYVFGYLLAKAFGMSLPKRKTLAIEIGMQNSGLGVALAMKFFDPASAVPSAIFSVWHNISGSILATFFSNMGAKSKAKGGADAAPAGDGAAKACAGQVKG